LLVAGRTGLVALDAALRPLGDLEFQQVPEQAAAASLRDRRP
jgi:hypothetical protein